jgi:hypothetical protein
VEVQVLSSAFESGKGIAVKTRPREGPLFWP